MVQFKAYHNMYSMAESPYRGGFAGGPKAQKEDNIAKAQEMARIEDLHRDAALEALKPASFLQKKFPKLRENRRKEKSQAILKQGARITEEMDMAYRRDLRESEHYVEVPPLQLEMNPEVLKSGGYPYSKDREEIRQAEVKRLTHCLIEELEKRGFNSLPLNKDVIFAEIDGFNGDSSGPTAAAYSGIFSGLTKYFTSKNMLAYDLRAHEWRTREVALSTNYVDGKKTWPKKLQIIIKRLGSRLYLETLDEVNT